MNPTDDKTAIAPTVKHFEAFAGDDGKYWTRRVWVQGDREWEEIHPTGIPTRESFMKELMVMCKEGKLRSKYAKGRKP